MGYPDPVTGDRPDAHRFPQQNLGRLTIAAIGIVYGDIGTSPLYTLRECFGGAHGLELTQDNVLGLLSLVLWALILVVTLKYVMFIMRADNHGEGGVLALMALAQKAERKASPLVIGAGLVGAALFFGDGIITPAISVLSAVEGLALATPVFEPYVVPIARARCAVRCPATGNRKGRRLVRSDYGGVVLRPRGLGRYPYRPQSVGAGRP